MANFDDLIMDPVGGVTPDHPEQHALIALLLKQLNTGKVDSSGISELIRDTIGETLVQGTNVTISINDETNQITISASGGGGGAVVDASETVKGIIEIATSAEVTTGTDAVRAVTPATLKVITDTLVESSAVSGLDTVGWLRGVFIANAGVIPGGTPDYTAVIELEA